MSSEPTTNSAGPLRWAGVSSVASLVVIASLGWYRRPVFDEWFFGSSVQEHGVFGFIAHGYTTFTGRLLLLSFGGVLSLAPMLVQVAVPLVVVVVSVVVLRSVLKSSGLPTPIAGVVAPVAIAAVIAGSPGRSQAVFWMIGALVYFVPAVCALSGVAVLVSPNRRWHPIAAAALAFIAASGNEMQAVIVPAGLAAIVVIARRFSSRAVELKLWLAFAGASVGGIVLLASPGNSGRRAMQGDRVHHDLETMASSMWLVVRVTALYIVATGLFPALALFALGLFASRFVSFDRGGMIRAHRLLGALTVLCFAVFCFVSAWAFNKSAHPRGMSTVWFTFAAFVFVGGLRRGTSEHATKKRAATVRPAIPAPLVLGTHLGAAVLLLAVFQQLPMDRAAAKQIDCVNNALRRAGTLGTTVVAPTRIDGMLLLDNDPGDEPNLMLSRRYGYGPVTRVGKSTTAPCQREATELRRYIPSQEFERN